MMHNHPDSDKQYEKPLTFTSHFDLLTFTNLKACEACTLIFFFFKKRVLFNLGTLEIHFF